MWILFPTHRNTHHFFIQTNCKSYGKKIQKNCGSYEEHNKDFVTIIIQIATFLERVIIGF